MKLTIIGANGKTGKLLVEEGLKRGHEITAVVRNVNKSLATSIISKDLFDLTKDDIESSDILISAIGAWTEETFDQHVTSVNYLANLLKGSKTQLVIVGGAGSLYLDATMTLQLSDSQGFPEEFKPLAKAMAKGLEVLRNQVDIDWLYVSPAANFDADGALTKNYQISGELFTVNDKGESYLSYQDYAFALFDILESDEFHHQRISLLGR